jgi:competence protein ComEC
VGPVVFNMRGPIVYFWKISVFIRLLPPFISGIIIQWQFPIAFSFLIFALLLCLLLMLAYSCLSDPIRFKFSFLNGMVCFALFSFIGATLTFTRNVQHSPNWFGNFYTDSSALLVTALEPPVVKERSIKVMANVSSVITNYRSVSTKGKIILYVDRNTPITSLQYGASLLFKKKIQEIKNSGNPGAFDYRQYCLFQGISHQVYLGKNEFYCLPEPSKQNLPSFIFSLKQQILSILKKYIRGEKETGLAEALLVGYRDDLDKSLVQSYSNTGVVHIIAISGLHLGLIYLLMVKLVRPISRLKKYNWLCPILIISGLWLFSLLAGAQPSVLRSALMFSCLALGEGLNRKTNIYNSLALSAFLLLCFNPFTLWDTGFQLSYAAVISLVIFMRSINNLLSFKSKLLNATWKLCAVTLSAQVLTLPLCIFYFHQLPAYFLVTNLVAVPLSSIILVGEIILVAISFLTLPASILGQLLSLLTRCMNNFIEAIDGLPFSTWGNLQVSLTQTIILFLLISAVSYWLMQKELTGLKAGLVFLFAFLLLRSSSFVTCRQQSRLIVYNVPQKKAIDLVEGNNYLFIGDSSLQNGTARNYHLNPARTQFRCTTESKISAGHNLIPFLTWQGKHILLVDAELTFKTVVHKPSIDLLILSGRPLLTIKNIFQALKIKQVVVDGSVPRWKAALWKEECEQLGIPWHDVSEKGAFAIKLR